ncbi:MAG: EAL domain-containing protein [Parasporobacterium sp.]|nr:EAL domain-containing protein [Parasporobacterium sp.]
MKKYQFTENERSILEKIQMPFAVYQFVDKRVVSLILSDGFCRLFGYKDRAEAYYDMDHNMYKDTHPDDTARISEDALRFATAGGTYDVIYRTREPEGSGYHIVHAIGQHIIMEDGTQLAHVWYTDEGAYFEGTESEGTMLNQTLKKALYKESLLQANYYDELTGLPSMSYFFELARDGKQPIIDNGGRPAILFMDLAGMRHYNHRHGFSQGDRLLQEFAKVLTHYFDSENCSRIGKDHFAVFTDGTDIEETLEKLFKEAKAADEGRMLPVRIGIFEDHNNDLDVSIACDCAKQACDSLGNIYSSAFKYYDDDMRRATERQQYIINNLDNAIKNRWIQVYYQPIVRSVNGRVCDEEALARWIDPVVGFLSPGEFIPMLEDAKLIYKLDLCILEQVLEKIKLMEEKGFPIVPQSVNLSRSDFECCDIVEEICTRVDAAGVSHDRITIEITESVVGRDFDFIRKEILRFQELGFPVWMDDFGSGYSSLDVLQSIRFNLLKFDMRFMQEFDKGSRSRIILTELMKMATSIGVDTVCEGVETLEQVRFLQEIGCSRLQGFYYAKPMPLSEILERYEKNIQIGFENPEESDYFETLGRMNLYDLAMMTSEDRSSFHNYFDTLPMGIVEVRGKEFRFVRTNQSYREFVEEKFGFHLGKEGTDFREREFGRGDIFMDSLIQCSESGNRMFVEEKLPDGSEAHSFIRRIAVNPVEGTTAIGTVVLSVADAEQGTTYANIAKALAADYFNLFYVDLETEDFIEYTSEAGEKALSKERHGENFFAASQRDAMVLLHEDDAPAFVKAFTKENVVKEMKEHGTFTTSYRLKNNGNPIYVLMKGTKMDEEGRYIILAVSNIDAQMREKEALRKIRQESVAYARIAALEGDYIALYIVDPVTDYFVEYRATTDFDGKGIPKEGENFFETSVISGEKVVYPEDLQFYIDSLTKEKVMQGIEKTGHYRMRYRLLLGGKIRKVNLRAALVKESDGDKLIIGVNDVTDQLETV